MTLTVLIAGLFLAGTGFAVATMATTLRAYWPAVVALRDAARYLPEEQELRVTHRLARCARWQADVAASRFRRRRPVQASRPARCRLTLA
jgi:hypothetical protein